MRTKVLRASTIMDSSRVLMYPYRTMRYIYWTAAISDQSEINILSYNSSRRQWGRYRSLFAACNMFFGFMIDRTTATENYRAIWLDIIRGMSKQEAIK